jgi:hypothetical protein
VQGIDTITLPPNEFFSTAAPKTIAVFSTDAATTDLSGDAYTKTPNTPIRITNVESSMVRLLVIIPPVYR